MRVIATVDGRVQEITQQPHSTIYIKTGRRMLIVNESEAGEIEISTPAVGGVKILYSETLIGGKYVEA